MRAVELAIGRIRLVRGRCPSCASAPGAAYACGTCHGYQGPFPVSEDTHRRWLGRFARSRRVAPVVSAAERPMPVWSAVR